MTLFGAWLVQHGRATAAQILRALEVQERQRPALHEVAMSMRRVTPTQVLEILDAQRRSGLTFEKQAVQSGFLTNDDMTAIRAEHLRFGPKLGEVLVQLGYFSVVQMERDLEEFLSAEPGPPRMRASPAQAFAARR